MRDQNAQPTSAADRAVCPQAQTQHSCLSSLGYPSARPRDPGPADRVAGMEGDLQPPGAPALAAVGRCWRDRSRAMPASWRRKPMLAVARGKDPAAEQRAERGAGTFADLADRYLEICQAARTRAWPQARALIERYALLRWGKLQAGAITQSRREGDDARGSRRRSLANQTLAAVSAIFSWGAKEEIVTSNPCAGVDRNPTRSRERILSAGPRSRKFWKAFDDAGRLRVPR